MKAFLYFFLLAPFLLLADGSAGSRAFYESVRIIDLPTAGVIPRNHFMFGMTVMESGGLVTSFSYSPLKDVNIGISYGGAGVLGGGTPMFQKLPGFMAKWRIIDETRSLPAFAIGINTQGIGVYDNAAERNAVYSPGLFLAASKNFSWPAGQLALHGGLCYSFDPDRSDRSPNFYLGAEQSVGAHCALVLEYNATADDHARYYLQKKGLLNSSFRWSVVRGLTIELQVRDLLRHGKNDTGYTRYLGIEYIASF